MASSFLMLLQMHQYGRAPIIMTLGHSLTGDTSQRRKEQYCLVKARGCRCTNQRVSIIEKSWRDRC
jgi:hypothetical protein